jgi:hypothetical protein
MPWIELVCKKCGETDLVMSLSKCGETGLCWKCQTVADGIRDEAGNWLGKYARPAGLLEAT